MKNIQKISRLLKYVLYGWATANVALPFFIFANGKVMENLSFMVGFDKNNHHTTLPFDVDKYLSFTTGHKFLVALSAMPSEILYSIALIFAAKLFECYEKGHYFSVNAYKKFGNIGKFFILSVLISYPQELLFTFVSTMKEPVGQRLIRITASNHDVTSIAMALMIIVVGWVMKEAVRLKQDQDLTV
tara:strand:+ start:11943 stop:12503 length:561 start_codon:yes stop_codon:yes gene_type:complete